MYIIAILIILIASMFFGFYKLMNSNLLSDSEANNNNKSVNSQLTETSSKIQLNEKWTTEPIKKAVKDINTGVATSDFNNVLYDLNNTDSEEAKQLLNYATAMFTMYSKSSREGRKNREWDLQTSVDGAKGYIDKINENYDGPFSDEINKLKKAMKNKKPEIGMTELEILFACDVPKDINSTKTANGSSEQWCYKNSLYVYFDDGVVTCIQN